MLPSKVFDKDSNVQAGPRKTAIRLRANSQLTLPMSIVRLIGLTKNNVCSSCGTL